MPHVVVDLSGRGHHLEKYYRPHVHLVRGGYVSTLLKCSYFKFQKCGPLPDPLYHQLMKYEGIN